MDLWEFKKCRYWWCLKHLLIYSLYLLKWTNDYSYYTLITFILIYILQLNDILVFIHNKKVVFVHVNVGLETAGSCSCKIELVLVASKDRKIRERNIKVFIDGTLLKLYKSMLFDFQLILKLLHWLRIHIFKSLCGAQYLRSPFV